MGKSTTTTMTDDENSETASSHASGPHTPMEDTDFCDNSHLFPASGGEKDQEVSFVFEGKTINMPYEPERVDPKGQGQPTGVYGLTTGKPPSMFEVKTSHDYVHVALAIQQAFGGAKGHRTNPIPYQRLKNALVQYTNAREKRRLTEEKEDGRDPFKIKARGGLLTYNNKKWLERIQTRVPWVNQIEWSPEKAAEFIRFYQAEIDKFEEFAKTLFFTRISTSWELNKSDGLHFHIYFDNETKVECTTREFTFEGITPHFKGCSARGRSQAGALDRGHYYTQCEKKIGRLGGSTNHPLNPKAEWLRNFVVKGDLDPRDAIRLAKENICYTSHFKHVMMGKIQQTQRDKDVATLLKRKAEVDSMLNCAFHDSESKQKLEEVDHWWAQFDPEKPARPRYRFLVICGDSMLGKSQYLYRYIQDIMELDMSKQVYLHNSSWNWKNNGVVSSDEDGIQYNWHRHKCIVFEDVPQIEQKISAMRTIFQSGFALNNAHNSATGCHAVGVVTQGVPIAITCNRDTLNAMMCHPAFEWIIDNMHLVELEAGETLYKQPTVGGKRKRHNAHLHERYGRRMYTMPALAEPAPAATT